MRDVAAVAQLDRVLGYEPRGRGFNSCQPHHISKANTIKPAIARLQVFFRQNAGFRAINFPTGQAARYSLKLGEFGSRIQVKMTTLKSAPKSNYQLIQ